MGPAHQLKKEIAKSLKMTTTNSIRFDALPDAAFVRAKALAPLLSISVATLWRWVKSGGFPKPIKPSAGVTAWQVGAVRAWMQTKHCGSQGVA